MSSASSRVSVIFIRGCQSGSIGEHFRIEPELPSNDVERWRIGQFLTLVRGDDMARGAPCLRYAFAVVGIGRERALRPEGRSKHRRRPSVVNAFPFAFILFIRSPAQSAVGER